MQVGPVATRQEDTETAMSVTIKNLNRRTRTFNLEHPTFVNKPGDNGAGKPEVLTMLPREVMTVDDDVLLCKEVRAAMAPRTGRPSIRVIG